MNMSCVINVERWKKTNFIMVLKITSANVVLCETGFKSNM